MSRLSPAEELDVKDEGGVGRDQAGEAAGAVCVVGRAGQLGALALWHLGDALVPALKRQIEAKIGFTHSDDLALAKYELEHLATVAGGVELGAIGQGAGVVDLDGAALGREVGAVAGLDDLLFNTHGYSKVRKNEELIEE